MPDTEQGLVAFCMPHAVSLGFTSISYNVLDCASQRTRHVETSLFQRVVFAVFVTQLSNVTPFAQV